MKKVALLYCFDESEWVSCKTIVKNLKTSYLSLKNEFEIQCFDYDHTKGAYAIDSLGDELLSFEPELVVFLDHKPTPIHIISKLLKLEYKPQISIHLYGDFSYYARDWMSLSEALKEFEVQYFTASSSAKSFVDQFFEGTFSSILMPFSIEDYFFKEPESQSPASIDKESINFLYTGRITSQKNVLELVSSFLKYKRIRKSSSKLFLAGCFDDEGSPFFGFPKVEGLYHYSLYKLLQSFPEFKTDVVFLGTLSKPELMVYYDHCDYFVSLSTFHDEDFGMSPAEAMARGMKTILTSWGGYRDFGESKDLHFKIPVELDGEFFGFNEKIVLKSFLLATKSCSATRKSISKKTLSKFSIENCTDTLRSSLAGKWQKFPGFNDKLFSVVQCFENSPHSPFAFRSNEVSFSGDSLEPRIYTKPIYKEIYSAYID